MNAARFFRVALLALVPMKAGAQDGWSLKSPGIPLQVSGKALDPLNVSGMACVTDKRFVMVCDELKHGVQTGLLDLEDGRMVLEENEVTLQKGGKKELDLEDVTADPERHRYYACGSCGVSRKTGEQTPNRQWLFRIETDPETGMILPDKVSKVSLAEAMRADPFLTNYLGKDPEDLGIDVEGVAFKDGRLWFGLRSPNLAGKALVVAASADDLMAGKPLVLQRFELAIGVDLGIRSIARIDDGFLLISGPTGTRASGKLPFALWFWAGTAVPPMRVGELVQPPAVPGGKDAGGKPEGLTVVSESRQQIKVIVVSDDADHGAPTVYEVGKPTPRRQQ